MICVSKVYEYAYLQGEMRGVNGLYALWKHERPSSATLSPLSSKTEKERSFAANEFFSQDIFVTSSFLVGVTEREESVDVRYFYFLSLSLSSHPPCEAWMS